MHTDPELLGLLALGEHVGTVEDRTHAETCPECALELSELHRLASLGRSVSPETTMATPGHDVWARIRDELHFDPTLEPPVHRSMFLPSDTLQPPINLQVGAGLDQPVTAPEHPPTSSPRRSLLATIKSALGGSSATPAAEAAAHELAAHAELSPVEAFWSQASGTAELATDELGRRVLQIALNADLPTSGVRQAWLVHRDDPSLRQTVGILDGPHGLWTVDHSIDLQAYAILEVSQQASGEVDHSGRTIVRGELALIS
ncbi:MAG: hypothetical protein ACR2LI_16425 [Propionibacteriaceae bacterium]